MRSAVVLFSGWLFLGGVVAVGQLTDVERAQQQTPHGPYANQEGVKCYRGETRDLPNGPIKKMVHCACALHCAENGEPREGSDCQTYCDNQHDQCLCHTDEYCGANQ